jgi:hypothetical protein
MSVADETRPWQSGLLFSGTWEEAFVESVRCNVDHGLPLALRDRRRAARRVLGRYPDWSDRRIGSLCGLSGKSVGRLRRNESAGVADDGGQVVDLPRRIGRDGKTRPVRPGEVRDRIRQALGENPHGSLRAIAAMAGSSPETVRTVRGRLIRAKPELPAQPEQAPLVSVDPAAQEPGRVDSAVSVAGDQPDRPARGQVETSTDQAAVTTEQRLGARSWADHAEFARWFTNNQVDDEWRRYVWSVPLGRVYEVVDEARQRAASWTAFASLLEGRTR